MAYLYNTRSLNKFFDVLLAELVLEGAPKLTISTSTGLVLATLPFTTPIELGRTEESVALNPPEPKLVLADGEATTGSLTNGKGDVVVIFDVGSPTTNPDAELIISSTTLYAGGMITINKVELKV